MTRRENNGFYLMVAGLYQLEVTQCSDSDTTRDGELDDCCMDV